jgi:hypothetical protein
VIGAALVYRYDVHRIHNSRPLGGRNVDISRSPGVQSQAAIAISPRDPRLLVAAANDDTVHVSADGGRTWASSSGPATAIGSCPHRTPRVALDADGREYLAFLAGRLCDDDLTSYVVVAERDSPTAPWRLARVTSPAWSYGYDDGPALAVDRDGTVYVAFERSCSELRATTVVSRSSDHGRTWSPPVVVSDALVQPHLVSLAAAGADVYVAGIDAKLGVWVARSGDGGRSFGVPRRVARLVQNPAGDCSLVGFSPVPREQERCTGPNPALLVDGDLVAVVYADAGPNGSGEVFVGLFDRNLRPRFHGQVNPPDRCHAARQSTPVAAVDASTGILWACWYDTTGDSRDQNAWFTCSASRNGRVWSAPERAAGVPSEPDALYADGAKSGFYPSLAAGHGAAHPAWIDTRRIDLLEELYTATLPEPAELRR